VPSLFPRPWMVRRESTRKPRYRLFYFSIDPRLVGRSIDMADAIAIPQTFLGLWG